MQGDANDLPRLEVREGEVVEVRADDGEVLRRWPFDALASEALTLHRVAGRFSAYPYRLPSDPHVRVVRWKGTVFVLLSDGPAQHLASYWLSQRDGYLRECQSPTSQRNTSPAPASI